MSYSKSLLALIAATVAVVPFALADDDPREVRHELMEHVGKAAKPVGAMFKGESEYDAERVMKSLKTWKKASMRLGDLFPPGTESGDTKAAPAIWEDRAGFEEALATWQDAVNAAIEAAPQTLEDAKPTVGPVFNACKNCHDNYRLEDD